MRLSSLFFLCFSVVFGATTAKACQTAFAPDSKLKVMGKNYVWPYGHGRIFLNRRNVYKKALLAKIPYHLRSLEAKLEPATWTSKYASLGFAQIAEFFSNGGVNEKGLGVEILLARADYPTATKKKAISKLQWIQYILDTAADIKEAEAQARKVDIMPIGAYGVHFHVCDRSGACAVFEYLDGELVVSREEENKENPIAVTNSTYGASPNTRSDFGIGGTLFPERFLTRSHSGIRELIAQQMTPSVESKKVDEVAAMFGVMHNLSAGPQWQIVYELATARIHFKVQKEYASFGARTEELIRTVGLSDFNESTELDCRDSVYKSKGKLYFQPAQRLDFHRSSNKQTKLTSVDFSRSEIGPTLVEESHTLLRSAGVDAAMIRRIAQYNQGNTYCLLE